MAMGKSGENCHSGATLPRCPAVLWLIMAVILLGEGGGKFKRLSRQHCLPVSNCLPGLRAGIPSCVCVSFLIKWVADTPACGF